MKKPVVVQHCVALTSIGGPMTALRHLLTSETANRFDFRPVYQNRAAGGINLALIKEMAEEIKSHQPDLVHVRGLQNEGFHGVLAAKMAGAPKILVSVHGFAGILQNQSGLRNAVFSRVIEPLTLRLSTASYCVAGSGAINPIYAKNAKFDLGVIHNGIPISAPPSAIPRQDLGFSDDDFVLVCVGRVAVEKGLGVLADAFKNHIAPLHPQARLLVIGDGPYLEELRTLLSAEIASGKAVLAGKQTEVARYLAMSDAFVFPTFSENLSNALLEAMLAGLPVVATNVGGNPEVMIDDETGFLVPPQEAKPIADKVNALIEDPNLAKRLGNGARKRIEDAFSFEKAAREIGNAYDRLLAL